jgi:hypothetical protein
MHLTLDLLTYAAALTTMVPPGEYTENHAHPQHYGQPVIRRFERRPEDDDRRLAWESYVQELDNLWLAYRAAGSTPRAWLEYRESVSELKRRYIFADPYYAPVLPVPGANPLERLAPSGPLFPATPMIPQPPVIYSKPNVPPYNPYQPAILISPRG